MYGPPEVLRVDSEGAFRSMALSDRCSDYNIELEFVAGEAHWQMGVTEQVIGDITNTMYRLQDARPDLSPKELLSLATFTHNSMERHKGFSPIQWAYGRGITWENTLHEGEVSSEAMFLENNRRKKRILTGSGRHK